MKRIPSFWYDYSAPATMPIIVASDDPKYPLIAMFYDSPDRAMRDAWNLIQDLKSGRVDYRRRAALEQGTDNIYADLAVQTAKRAVKIALEEAAKVAEQKAQEFLSPEYATGQPLSSFNERFACGQIAAAIRSLKERQP